MVIKIGVFLCGLAIFCLPILALADEPVAQIKIISEPQTINTNTPSGVFTLEAQDSTGNKVNVAATTRVSLGSSSASGQFFASAASGPCGSAAITSVTISNSTSHKSFCYTDPTAGSYTISISVPEQAAVLGDSQAIIINGDELGSTPPPDLTTPPATFSALVKIYRFMPNPAGEDAGNEWVEIKNLDAQDVSLDGWFLDDKGTAPAESALVLNGQLAPGETKKFIAPASTFSLTNTGDEINLYFPDKTLADKASYTALAYDDAIFALTDNLWQPPPQPVSPSPSPSTGNSGGGSSSVSGSQYYGPTVNFKLDEIFPNPLGEDSGKEWLEIYNPTTSTSSLEGYFLDDGDLESFTASAWALPKDLLVPPKGVLAVSLKNSFSLKNTGTGKIKLFSPQKQLLDEASYKDAPENQSWAKNQEEKWQWSVPTFNLSNDQIPELLKIIISEIFPKPSEDGEEFIELFNMTGNPIDLEGVVLQVGSRKKTFEAKTGIEAGGFLTIYEDDLPGRLSNDGQNIKLYDAFGRLAAEVVYPKATEGQVYATDDGKNYAWTSSVTPGALNRYILGESVSVQAASLKSAPAKTPAAAITKTQATEILHADEDLKQQLAMLQESISQLQTRLASQNQTVSTQTISAQNPTAAKMPIGRLIVWPAALAALGGMVFVTLKKRKK